MKKYTLHTDLVRNIQASMLESAPAWWSEADRAHLRCLIRLNIEFFYYLQEQDMNGQSEVRFLGESVFSGIESLCSLAMTYRTMAGDTANPLARSLTSAEKVKKEFLSLYQDFSVDTNFDNRFRLLLNLFRLQIVFAGLTYR